MLTQQRPQRGDRRHDLQHPGNAPLALPNLALTDKLNCFAAAALFKGKLMATFPGARHMIMLD